ncbi:MAG TPA: hypothetical protein PK253_07530 [Spirochaetota bacterium]|nr:hypothetical protein [Spirochaetota bacterium]
MKLSECKKCPFHMMRKADEVMCSANNDITYRIVGRNERLGDFFVLGCPRSEPGAKYRPMLFEDKNPPFWNI